MSIIISEVGAYRWETERFFNDIRTTFEEGYEEGYLDGAARNPTDAEIVAGAEAFYEALKPDSYPQWDSDCALKAEYYDAMRLAVKAMQGKAAEE